MIFSNNKIRKYSAIKFLTVFNIFLVLSIFHSHHLDIYQHTDYEISEKRDEGLQDPLLDSSLNCTLHTFNNSLKFDKVFSLHENMFENKKKLYFRNSFCEYTNHSTNLNQKRGPPTRLV